MRYNIKFYALFYLFFGGWGGGQTAQRPGGKFDKIIFKDLTLNTVMNGGQQKRVAESVLIMFILSFEIITKLETTSLGTGLKD